MNKLVSPRTPEALSDKSKADYSLSGCKNNLGVVGLRLAGSETGLSPYDYDSGTVYREVTADGFGVGEFVLRYDYEGKVIVVDFIFLKEDVRHKKIGTALYKSALWLPLPGGEDPRENDFRLESYSENDIALKIWMGLVREDLAERGDKSDRHFIMR